MKNIMDTAKSTLNAFQALWTYKQLTMPNWFIFPDEKIPLHVTSDMITSGSWYDSSFKGGYYRFVSDDIPQYIPVTLKDLIFNRVNKNACDHILKNTKIEIYNNGSKMSSISANEPHFLTDHKTAADWLTKFIPENFANVVNYNWLPLKLAKVSICNYLSNKAVKFAGIYFNSKDTYEAGEKFVNSLGTIDEAGIVIPKIQHKLLDLAKSYISDSQLLGKAIVEATDILFAPIKGVDSIAYAAAPTAVSFINSAESMDEETLVSVLGTPEFA